jgi:hypothetical protein
VLSNAVISQQCAPPPLSHHGLIECVVNSFRSRCSQISGMPCTEIVQIIKCWDPAFQPCGIDSRTSLIVILLAFEFSRPVSDSLTVGNRSDVSEDKKSVRFAERVLKAATWLNKIRNITISWPVLPTSLLELGCARNYRRATTFDVPLACACCDRSKYDVEVFIVVP